MSAAPRAGLYANLLVLSLGLGLALHRPDLAAIALVPFVFLAVALAGRPGVGVTGSLLVSSHRTSESVPLPAVLELGGSPGARLNLEWDQDSGFEVEPARPRLRLDPRGQATVELVIRARRWGVLSPPRLRVTEADPLGMFRRVTDLEPAPAIKVFPDLYRLRTELLPIDTQLGSGNRVSRMRGEGTEFTEIRPFQAGDHPRRVNWAATSRTGILQVNQRLSERSAELVILVDSFGLEGAHSELLDRTVRAAWSLAQLHLRSRDRVGLIGYGGSLRWLVRGGGMQQATRIAEFLVGTQSVASYAWKGVQVLPPPTLPPQALVVAVTPLIDPRTHSTLVGIRVRGRDLRVLEVAASPAVPENRFQELAVRIWELQRQRQRDELAMLGVPVASWEPGTDLDSTLQQLARPRPGSRLR